MPIGGSWRPSHGSVTAPGPAGPNQFERMPTVRRNVSPVIGTDPAVPSTVIVSTRPPQSPCPDRVSTVMPVNSPIDGHAAVIVDAAIETRHVWYGLPAVASPRSSTAGNGRVLAADQPPEDDENIVSAIAPDEVPMRRT